MTKLEKLEHEIKKLDRKELNSLRDWFQNYDAEEWDRQIEDDVNEGKLDKLAGEALSAHLSGNTRQF